MSIIFFLLFLLSCTSLVSCTKDDGIALLKIKKQLGDPEFLSAWAKGFNFCNSSNNRYVEWNIGCTSTGRVSVLRFGSFNFKAPFPDGICDLSELEYLSLTQLPGLYGPISSCITKLFKLKELTIAGTSLSSSVPRFRNQTNLSNIMIQKNRLSGKIPRSLSTLQKLNQLDLSSNNLTGHIPPGLVRGRFAWLTLANNKLTGKVPRQYGLVDMQLINVANNKLSGDASFLFGKQKSTRIMILANNKFKFDLSDIEISDLLFNLDLSHNKIYGKIPNSFTAANLLSLDLSSNKLCGEIPQKGDLWQFGATAFENNKCLCGNPLPPCFTSVPAPEPVEAASYDFY